MDFLPNELISKIGSARKNFFPVLEQLAESEEKKKCMVVKEQKKQWGPVVATSRMNTRGHGDINILDKAREYQKRQNLEVPPSFKGNSFALLHPDTLLDMTKKKLVYLLVVIPLVMIQLPN
jgi:hypothetical protein